jgi:hypothetical protein
MKSDTSPTARAPLPLEPVQSNPASRGPTRPAAAGGDRGLLIYSNVCSSIVRVEAQVSTGVAALSRPVPVPSPLREVIPGGGLRPGTVTVVTGSTALALALTAGLGERWCAIVGMPEANVAAAAAMGLDPMRALLVDDPGDRWADTVAALTDGCALVLTRPPRPPAPHVARRLTALARRNGCALVVSDTRKATAGATYGRRSEQNKPVSDTRECPSGSSWAGANLRLRVETSHWSGLVAGTGHLRGRRALVACHGRGAAGAGRRAWLWLPGPDGSLTPTEETSRTLSAVAG